ncbi:hypothetical protein [Burkholderia arboris]|uniref:hypothetical protein n=1 Tax=Burkholderia arboris TaxID=488730 RepID=UPI003C7AE7CF
MSTGNRDTLEYPAPTDLTGALANFNIYVAIGNVEISSENTSNMRNQATFTALKPLKKSHTSMSI